MLIDFEQFPVGMVLFDQLPGIRFPTTPRVVATAIGGRAISNAQPREEFNPQSLRIDFTEAQGQVSLKAGLEISSSAPVSATFRAFDQMGSLITQDGPKQLGPGPIPTNTIFSVQVSPPQIRQVELEYSGAFAELIDDLEFDVEGDVAPPDVAPPIVRIIRPENGTQLTGNSFVLEATITEDRRLSEVFVTIAGEQEVVEFGVHHSGQTPNFKLGPFFTQPLALGSNDITVTARDFAGNEGQDIVTVNRVPLDATLVVPTRPEVLRRLIPHSVEIRLEETFPGSLDGRGEIDIRVARPDGVRGQVRIRDFLNQPEPQATLEILATQSARLGAASVFLNAVEAETGQVITTAELLASIVPPNPFECVGLIPFYSATTPEELRQTMEAGIDAAIRDREKSDVSTLTPLQLTFAAGQIRIFRRFRVEWDFLNFLTADINMSATIVRNSAVPFRDLADAKTLSEDELPFTYQPFRVNASPNIPVTDPITALLWRIAQALFESEFSDSVRAGLIRDFNHGIFERIKATNELAHLFLLETRIDTREFMFGFCIPRSNFPNPGENESESELLDLL